MGHLLKGGNFFLWWDRKERDLNVNRDTFYLQKKSISSNFFLNILQVSELQLWKEYKYINHYYIFSKIDLNYHDIFLRNTLYSIINTFCSKSLQNFIVFRAQKDGSADRSWFCELYDGEATAGVKASNDVKRITVEDANYALSIGGFHQPQPFLMEQSDLKLRRDGFMERFLLCCPFPKKMMYEEVISANDNLRSNYSPIT